MQPVKMLIFGDSLVRSHVADLKTWPELLAERLDFPSINAAIPGCDSTRLSLQLDLLMQLLEETGATVHEDAWALIHSGGNDIISSVQSDFLGLVTSAAGSALCCCSPCCCKIKTMEEAAKNIEELVVRLNEELGIHNVILVGPPITPNFPLVGQILHVAFGGKRCLFWMMHLVVRRANSIYNRRLARILRPFRKSPCDDTAHGVVLDEANAIDACIDGNVVSIEEMWADPVHLSQAGHEAIAEEMLIRWRRSAGTSIPEMGYDSLQNSDSDGDE